MISRTLAAFLGGFPVAFLLSVFSLDFPTFLRSELTVNVGMLLILALFGLIGVAAEPYRAAQIPRSTILEAGADCRLWR